ncbi:MAG TPA: DUF1538 domain-containing protein [Nevskiaceae bacterium]
MKQQWATFAGGLYGSTRDLLPIFLVVVVFQLAVVRQPLPDLGSLVAGMLMVIVGLTLFVRGLEIGLFPIGDALAYAFAHKGSLIWMLVFAFALGFGASAAEPALIAVADKAAQAAADSGVTAETAHGFYALRLRLLICAAVGFALVVGVLRIVLAWPMHVLLTAAYLLVVVISPLAPAEVMAIAYDSGPVSNSVITVPLVAALGVGIASSVEGRDPLVDGFGLVALSTVMPMIAVLAFGALA